MPLCMVAKAISHLRTLVPDAIPQREYQQTMVSTMVSFRGGKWISYSLPEFLDFEPIV